MKERLVGAAVLVAISVIVVPEFLSGPAQQEDPAPSTEARAAEGSSLKTYEIKLGSLNEPGDSGGGASGAASAGATSPAADEGRGEAPGKEPTGDSAAPQPEAPPGAGSSGSASAAARVAAQTESPAGAGPASGVSAGAGGWAVQAGSFANRSAAQTLAATLEQRGYRVFMMPFTSGSQTLYRVRVGPMKDRSEAEATLRRLARDGVKGAVVANP